VTTAIAQFMRELERAWEAHLAALLVRRDLTAVLASLAGDPSVMHIPAMTGAAGSQRVLWDQATLAAQLGVCGPTGRAASGPGR